MIPTKKYYLFYDLKTHSFHTPIYDDELTKYSSLKVEDIGRLITFGDDIDELISAQFVKKVIELITTGTYILASEN